MLNESKIRRIAELAQRGAPGERENAQELLRKAGVTAEQMLNTLSVEILPFTYRNKDEFDIIIQTICHVLDSTNITIIRYPRKGRKIGIEIPTNRLSECERAIKTFIGLYRRELKVFINAFIAKNQLFPTKAEESSCQSLSEEEIKEIIEMAHGIKKAEWRRQLTEGNHEKTY